jgi:hypothetical protein
MSLRGAAWCKLSPLLLDEIDSALMQVNLAWPEIPKDTR